jgi:cell division protein FtsL
MMRGMTILWTVLAVIIGIGLFLLKYQVKALEGQLAQVNRDIRAQQEAIHVMKAEWSYLNDPERLRELTERHLGMKPMRGEQMIQIADLPMAPPRPDAEPQQQTPPEASPDGRTPDTRAPEGRMMVDATPTQPAQPAAPLTRGIHLKPAERMPAASAAAPKPAKAEPQRTVVAAATTTAKPAPLKTETTPKPIVAKAEPVRSEALQSAFASAKPANPKPVLTTPVPASRTAQPAKLPTGAVMTSSPNSDVMVIKSPALMAAEAAGGRR